MRDYVGKHSKRAPDGRPSSPEPDGSSSADPAPGPAHPGDGAAPEAVGQQPAASRGGNGVAALPPAVPPVTPTRVRPDTAVAVLDAPARPGSAPASAGVAEPWIIPVRSGRTGGTTPAPAIHTGGLPFVRVAPPAPPLPSPVRETRFKARRWVRFGLFGLLILVLVATGSAYGLWQYGEDVWKAIPREDAVSRNGVLDAPAANEPVTVMLVGSDTRDLDDPNSVKAFGSTAKVGGQRADTIMLVHVDPKADRSWVVSLPRDLKVEIPGHGVDKVNSSFNYGPDVLVDTVRRFTGIPIHHYVEVNFESFAGIVDSFGGYEVCLERDARDTVLLWKLAAGCHHLTGQETLQFVRSRHFQERDPATSKWKGEGDGDMGRIKRQQEFLLNMASRLAGPGSLSNVGEYQDIAQRYLKLDAGFDFGTAISLFRSMTPLSPDKVEMIQLPWEYETGKGGASLVIPTPEGLAKLAELRAEMGIEAPPGAAGTPAAGSAAPAPGATTAPAPSPATVSVKVLNGSKVPGLASRVRVALRTKGFDVGEIGDAPAKAARTQVLSAGGPNDQQAVLVARELGYGEVVAGSAQGAEVLVVLGADAREPTD